ERARQRPAASSKPQSPASLHIARHWPSTAASRGSGSGAVAPAGGAARLRRRSARRRERGRRAVRSSSCVSLSRVPRWATIAPEGFGKPGRSAMTTSMGWLPSAIEAATEFAPEPLVVLDYDGTLAEIAPRPELAALDPATREAL